MNKKHGILGRIFHTIWAVLLNGLFTLLPITLTISVFNISFRLLKGWLEPLHRVTIGTLLDHIPHGEIILVIGALFVVGTIMRVFLLRSIVHAFEDIIANIPIVRPVYSGIKQLIGAFSLQDKITFKKVVLVEFPRKGIHSIGFLTSELPHEIAPNGSENYLNVFIPTTPNPTSGYFIMVPKADVQVVDLTRQEAMAMIISGGIIQPERLERK